MKKIFLLSIVCATVIFSCKSKLKSDFNFLMGSWKLETSDSTYIIEKWNKVDSLNYEGLVYNISPNGMELSEELKIEISDEGIYYIPIIGVISEDNPIFKFKLVSQDNGLHIFENKENEFPTQISYQLIDDSTLHAALIDSVGNIATTFKYQKTAE